MKQDDPNVSKTGSYYVELVVKVSPDVENSDYAMEMVKEYLHNSVTEDVVVLISRPATDEEEKEWLEDPKKEEKPILKWHILRDEIFLEQDGRGVANYCIEDLIADNYGCQFKYVHEGRYSEDVEDFLHGYYTED